MIVKDLIEQLQKLDQNAEVIIGGETVDSITTLRGRLKEGWLHKHFTRHEEKGKVTAVVFERDAEYADGKIYRKVI